MARMGEVKVRVERMDEFIEALGDTKALIAEVERLAVLRAEVRDAVILNVDPDALTTRLAGRLIEIVEAGLPPRVVIEEVEVECEHDDCSCGCDCCDNCKWCS